MKNGKCDPGGGKSGGSTKNSTLRTPMTGIIKRGKPKR